MTEAAFDIIWPLLWFGAGYAIARLTGPKWSGTVTYQREVIEEPAELPASVTRLEDERRARRGR